MEIHQLDYQLSVFNDLQVGLNLFKNLNFQQDSWNKLFKVPLHQIIDSYSSGMKKKLAILGVLKQDKTYHDS